MTTSGIVTLDMSSNILCGIGTDIQCLDVLCWSREFTIGSPESCVDVGVQRYWRVSFHGRQDCKGVLWLCSYPPPLCISVEQNDHGCAPTHHMSVTVTWETRDSSSSPITWVPSKLTVRAWQPRCRGQQRWRVMRISYGHPRKPKTSRDPSRPAYRRTS